MYIPYIPYIHVWYGSQKSSLSLCNNDRATEILRSVFVFVPLQKCPCFFVALAYFIERCQKRCKERRKNGAENVEKKEPVSPSVSLPLTGSEEDCT